MTKTELKTIRQKLKLTTKQLGGKLGVSGRTIEGWEQGRKIPRMAETMIKKTFQ